MRALRASVMVMILLGAVLAHADDVVTWQGYTWETLGWGSLATSNGELQVTTSGVTASSTDSMRWGMAHTQSSSLSSYATPWVQASFIDNAASGTGALLGIENPVGANPVWGEVGYDPNISTTHYGVYILNESTNAYEFVVLGQRTTGNHTVDIGRLADGTLDFYLDGQLVFTSLIGHADSLKDIYLYAGGIDAGGSVTFTSFSAGDGYARGLNGTFDPVQSVPEPASLFLFASGLGLVVARRFQSRKR